MWLEFVNITIVASSYLTPFCHFSLIATRCTGSWNSLLHSSLGRGRGLLGSCRQKKNRGSNSAAKNIASGEQSQATAQDMDSVCGLMRATQRCVESIYSLRHVKQGNLVSEALPELPLDGNEGMYVWPLCKGVTFKEIAQRAWESPDRLIDESWEMVCATGILDDSSTHSCNPEAQVLRCGG